MSAMRKGAEFKDLHAAEARRRARRTVRTDHPTHKEALATVLKPLSARTVIYHFAGAAR